MFKSVAVRSARGAVTVIGLASGEGKAPGVDAAAVKKARFRGDAGEVVILDEKRLLLGLGKKDDLKPETLRTIGARLLKALDRHGIAAATLQIAEPIPSKTIDAESAGRCVGEAMGLANWRVDFFDGKASSRKPARGPLSVDARDRRFRAGLERGLMMARSVNIARRLAATPPNICSPTWFAGEARKVARETGMTCRVIDFAAAQRLGMGGIVNVGKGSAAKPCLVILEHNPRKKRSGKTLALVGKTVTYDTGGYSLKISNGMRGMKYDKCGGCAVLGAMHAIASMDLPVHVVAFCPAAENMVSDESYRPDDIITMHNGVTVEVTNTDAEGRLVLADALSYACEKYEPDAIVDMATLTGGVVTALGSFCAGLFCNDEKLLAKMNAASEACGEKLWRLPLWKEHREYMRSQHADLINSNPSRQAHPIQGAAFMSYFVDEKTPWAHIDIAGVHGVEKDTDLYVAGPNGYGVRLLTELAERFG